MTKNKRTPEEVAEDRRLEQEIASAAASWDSAQFRAEVDNAFVEETDIGEVGLEVEFDVDDTEPVPSPTEIERMIGRMHRHAK